MMNKITNSPWFTAILALFFALLLFFNANASPERMANLVAPESSLTATAEEVPIKLDYDETKYFVSGYEETTTVYLKSANKILLDTETNDQTRGFRLVANLNKFKEGTYEVPIKVEKLNRAVEATLKTKTIHVTIERRETKKFKVEARVNDNLLKKGYSLGTIASDPLEVEITSGANTLSQITHVVASIDDDSNLSEDLSKKVDVVATDKDGNTLSVIIVPTTVTVNVAIEAPSKSVPIRIKQSGSIAPGIKKFDYAPSQENVTISGPRETIDKITEIELLVDTSDITSKVTRSFKVDAGANILVNPSAINVVITPTLSDKATPTKDSSKPEAKPSTTKSSSSKTTESPETTNSSN